MTKDESKPRHAVRTRHGCPLALLRDVELIAIALLIVLSIGLAVAATKLVMDALLAAMRLRHRDRAHTSATWRAKVPPLYRHRKLFHWF